MSKHTPEGSPLVRGTFVVVGYSTVVRPEFLPCDPADESVLASCPLSGQISGISALAVTRAGTQTLITKTDRPGDEFLGWMVATLGAEQPLTARGFPLLVALSPHRLAAMLWASAQLPEYAGPVVRPEFCVSNWWMDPLDFLLSGVEDSRHAYRVVSRPRYIVTSSGVPVPDDVDDIRFFERPEFDARVVMGLVTRYKLFRQTADPVGVIDADTGEVHSVGRRRRDPK